MALTAAPTPGPTIVRDGAMAGVGPWRGARGPEARLRLRPANQPMPTALGRDEARQGTRPGRTRGSANATLRSGFGAAGGG